MRRMLRTLLLVTAAVPAAASPLAAQRTAPGPEVVARRWELERELQAIAVVERKLMLPMRDGVRLATDVYRPKNAPGRVPTIFSKTPYNFNYWDVRTGAPRDMSTILDAVRRVAAGDPVLSPAVTRQLMAHAAGAAGPDTRRGTARGRVSALNDREREVALRRLTRLRIAGDGHRDDSEHRLRAG